jgi:hypothetical protein
MLHALVTNSEQLTETRTNTLMCCCAMVLTVLCLCGVNYATATGGSSELVNYVTPCSYNAAASETAGSLHNCSTVSSSNRDIYCNSSYAVISAQPVHSAATAAAATVTPITAGADERLAECGSSSSSYSSISSYTGYDCDSNRELRCLSAPTTDYCTDTTTAGTISTADTGNTTVVYDVRRVAGGSSSGTRRVRAPHAGDARAFEVTGTEHNESFSCSVSSGSGMRGSADNAVTWLLTRHRPTLRLVSACNVL